MKRTSGNFAAIFIDPLLKPFSVYGNFEIYPSNTIGVPVKNYHSGNVTCHVKNIDSQEIVKSYPAIHLKIVGEKWSIGTEPSFRQWTPFYGEPFDTILSQVREEYFDLNPEVEVI